MKKTIYFFILATIALFGLSFSPQKSGDSDQKMHRFIDDLMKKMTLEEKIGQLNLPAFGDIVTGQASSSNVGTKIKNGLVGGLFNLKSVKKIREVQRIAVEESRLKIPLIFGMDVIHGYQTTFPIPLAMAASFDPSLVERMARVAATEATADGICWNFSPMVDISRDPRWGRIAESAGEDPYLGSKLAEAYVKGYQGERLSDENTMMACVKHFALYGASEAGRDYNTVDMSKVRMYNEYLPPYKAAVDAGVGSVMTSFNEIDGMPATGNKWLLTNLLRDQWGFNGFVVTDYTAINEMIDHGMGDLQQVSALALKAGTDMDMVGEGFLTSLKKSLDEGKVSENDINQACRRILEAKYKLGLFDDPYRYCNEERAENEIFTVENNRIARETATQTFVLLKNDQDLLPIEAKGKIALIGPLADNIQNMPGTWSVAADYTQSVTVLQGFTEAMKGKGELFYAKGCNIVDDATMDARVAPFGRPSFDQGKPSEQLLNEAVATAKKADIIVAVMGEAAEMSGESSSRTDIGLPENQRTLLAALLKTGKPVVMVLFAGRPMTLSWENDNIPAILNVWFAGTQAGNAIADVVFGKTSPSGKLPATFPVNVGQIPIYYNHKNTGRPLQGAWFQKFRSNYLDVPNEPLFPFGFGLSYGRFEYSDFNLSKTQLKGNDQLIASVSLTNNGKHDAQEVVQLYIRDWVGSITRPVAELKGIQKVLVKSGETKNIQFTITPEDLKFYNAELKYDWEAGDFDIMIGGNSRDLLKKTIHWEK